MNVNKVIKRVLSVFFPVLNRFTVELSYLRTILTYSLDAVGLHQCNISFDSALYFKLTVYPVTLCIFQFHELQRF